MQRINISEVNFKEKFYPREKPSTATIERYMDSLKGGAKFPPIQLARSIVDVVDGRTVEHKNVLIDGYHRWKAHEKLVKEPELDLAPEGGPAPEAHDFSMIDYEYCEIPEGIPVKLYAISLSSKHGLGANEGDKRATAREIYTENLGFPLKAIQTYMGISHKTAKGYVADLLAQYEDSKRALMLRLSLLGWTVREVSDKLDEVWPDAKGTGKSMVSDFCPESGNSDFSDKIQSDIKSGHPIDKIAKRYELAPILVWALSLQGKEDAERMAALKIKIQPYNVWNFSSCHDAFGSKHPGRIPGELVAHVLYFYTQQDDTIIDPMVGSGTTIDVCLAMGRKCYGYDADSRHERPDVIAHDMATGWPERIKKANLIFWDPPYFSKMDDANKEDGYNEKSISKLGKTEYLAFFQERLSEARALVKKGARLAFLMSDWYDYEHEGEGVLIGDYLNVIETSGWRFIKHIQTPLPTQQVPPFTVNNYREKRRMASLDRYLLIATA